MGYQGVFSVLSESSRGFVGLGFSWSLLGGFWLLRGAPPQFPTVYGPLFKGSCRSPLAPPCRKSLARVLARTLRGACAALRGSLRQPFAPERATLVLRSSLKGAMSTSSQHCST